jgi:RNA-directed DNA polymerase
VVLHFDLCRFFPSISAARVRAVFRTAGYPPAVARLLAGLCTNAVPSEVLGARPANARRPRGNDDRVFLSPHLPQGAPTSPALANLSVFRLDCRLDSLSRAAGARYTRYADDLVFSGEAALERSVRRFHVLVCLIALEEGFEINTRKSHFMRQGVRQQVAGIVLNARPNVPREDFDRLKATLTNCVRNGPDGQNRDRHADFRAYLSGRISYVTMIHPARGRRLRELFERIVWTG